MQNKTKCRYADRYKATRPPTCGCDACERKWRRAEFERKHSRIEGRRLVLPPPPGEMEVEIPSFRLPTKVKVFFAIWGVLAVSAAAFVVWFLFSLIQKL